MKNTKSNQSALTQLQSMRLFRRLLPILFCMVVPLNLMAQKTTITGLVVDSKNEGIIGANVIVKGSKLGTITDFNGNFALLADSKDVIVISYLGMNTLEVAVGSSKNLRIVMTDDTKALEEVVVIGYGSVKKKDVTTAISTISTKDLDQRPIITADQALQGKAAGVSVIKPNGAPGQAMVIRVRGTTSMNSSNDPLYVVDGVAMDNIAFLSANDIESIQVLKDASSAAIYGSRAANGVILISTKSGVAGKSKITLNAYSGFTNLSKEIPSLNVAQYRELLDDLGSTVNIPVTVTDKTDWYKETFQTAVAQNYQLSISNATDKLKYYLSAGYTGENGILKSAFFQRFNVHSNIENQIRPWLKVGANITYSDYTNNGVITGQGSNRGGVVLAVINTPTYAPVWDATNPTQYNTNFYGVNITSPVENMARSENNAAKNNRLISTGSTEISFTPHLKLRSTVTMDRTYYNYTSFLDPLKTTDGRNNYGNASDNRSLTTVMIYDNILSYNQSFGKHNIDFMGGTSGTTSDYTTSYQTVSNFIDGTIQTLNAGNKLSQGNGSFAAKSAMMSYVSRLAYNYDSKYLATINFRADGSSKLAPNHKWGYFPSASAAWRVSSEDFMKDLSWVDDMKIRVGWGQTGNIFGLGDFDYLARSRYIRVNWWEAGNTNAVPLYTQNSLSNNGLTWETTTQSNIGIDLTILKNRLTFAIDYYYKLTTNMLMNVTLPAGSAPTNSITRNEGEMTNKGFEFALNSVNLDGKFKWSTDFNISFNRNMLTKLTLSQVYNTAKTSNNIDEFIVRNAPGHSLGGFYGYISDGVDPETGELIYRDIDGNGSITTSDRTYIGDPNPNFMYGMTNVFAYRNLNLSILLQGSQGNSIFNASRIETEGMYNAINQSTRVLSRWRRPGMETKIPKAGYDMKISSYFVEDGSFLRVKDISLSYNVPTKILKKLGISKLQPYMSCTNILTITKYLGFDPEVNQWGNSGAVQGIDWGTYPQTKSIIIGLNLEF